MLIVTPYHIDLYSKCPRRCKNAWSFTPQELRNPASRIYRNTILYAYLRLLWDQQYLSWRAVKSRALKLLNEEAARSNSSELFNNVNILTVLHKWYFQYHLEEYASYSVLPNVPIVYHIDSNLAYNDSIDLLGIKAGNQLSIFDFQEAETKRNCIVTNILSDMKAYTRAWGLWKETGISSIKYVRMFLTPNSIYPVETEFGKNRLEIADKNIKLILRGIKDDVFYPSFSEQCIRCPFVQGCLI